MEDELELLESEIEEVFEKDDYDIYTEEGIDDYVDNDGITPSEQGFMSGYLDA